MKTSPAEIVATEKYLLGKMPHGDALVFQARLITDRELRTNSQLHRLVHRLVRLYHRKKLKAELLALHGRMLADPARRQYSENIRNLFNH